VRRLSLRKTKEYILSSLVLCLSLSFVTGLVAQDVRLTNPSFEDTPRQGRFDERTGIRTQPIKGWFDCGAILFPRATPPDIHKGSSNYWENELTTAHGKTYVTLVVREDDTYETISQKVLGTLKAGHCYSFSISLARSKKYISPTRSNSKLSY